MSVEAVWTEFSERLRAFIVRRVKAPEDADDLLQEVFLRIHRASGSLAEADRLPAWLFQITRNALIDHYRSSASRRRYLTGSAEGGDEEPATDAAADAREEEQLAVCLTPMVDALPEPYREALRLTGLSGVSQADAADQLGLSASGMKSRVQRGRRLLRDLLLRCCEVDFDRRGGVASFRSRGNRDAAGCAGGAGGCVDGGFSHEPADGTFVKPTEPERR